jgi:hypothetical protein
VIVTSLQQVVKFTPESHHDYKALTNALERVRCCSLGGRSPIGGGEEEEE